MIMVMFEDDDGIQYLAGCFSEDAPPANLKECIELANNCHKRVYIENWYYWIPNGFLAMRDMRHAIRSEEEDSGQT